MNKQIEEIYNSVRNNELVNRLQRKRTVSDLNHLYTRIELEEPKANIKKKPRAAALAYYVLNLPHKVIACLTPGEILWLNELAEKKVMPVEEFSVDYLTLSLIFDLKLFDIFRVTIDDDVKIVAIIYDDTVNAFSEALKKAALEIKHTTTLSAVRTYVSGLLNLCGFLSMQEIILAIAAEEMLPKVDDKDIQKVFNGFRMFSKFDDIDDMPDDIWFAGNNFVHIDSAPDIIAKREAHSLHPVFTYRTVVEAALFPTPKLPAEIVNPLAKRLRKFFASERETIGFITERWLFLQVMSPVDFMKTTIEKLDTSDADLNETLAIVQDMNNTLPRFEFYGHSSTDARKAAIEKSGKVKPRFHFGNILKQMEGMDEEEFAKLFGDKLLEEFDEFTGNDIDEEESDDNDIGRYIARNSITPWVNTNPKIGRNDPCPCGSGKKYKNCCGKNK